MLIIGIIIIGVCVLLAGGIFIYVLCQMTKLVRRQEEWLETEKDYNKKIQEIKDKGQS